MRSSLRGALVLTSAAAALLLSTGAALAVPALSNAGTPADMPSPSFPPMPSSSPTAPAPVPSLSPQPSGNPQPSGSPLPSGSPQPSGSPLPSGSPQPSGDPQPSTSPTPPSAGGTIQGTLTAADGSPLLAWVAVQSPSADVYLTGGTDATGHYRFDNVPPGSYVVYFETNGILTQFVPGKTSIGDAGRYTVTAGAVTTVDDRQLPTGTITGHFRDRAGHGVVAQVSAVPDAGDWLFIGSTDADGAYSALVFAGTYAVQFRYHDSVQQYAYQQTDQSQAARFTVAAGQTVTVDDTTLPTGTVAGRILDSDGSPAAGAYVQLSGATDQSTTTGADGSYRIDNVPVGDYTVRIATADNRRYQWVYGTTNQNKASTVTVKTDATTTVDDRFVPTGTLVVTATTVDGVAFADFCVYLWGGGTEGRTCSNGTGQVTVTGIPAGDTYRFDTDVDSESYLPVVALPVTITGGQTTTKAVVLHPAAAIDSTVLDARTHQPVDNVCVAAITASWASIGENPGSCSGPDGKVHMPYLAPGQYTLYAMPRDGAHGQQWVGATHGTGNPLTALRIDARPGTVTAGPTIYLDPAGSISGTVVDAKTGAPVPRVCVGQTSVSSAWVHVGECPGAVTDAGGHYTISGVGPYAWPVEFASSDTYAWQWSGGVPNRLLARPVTVTAGATATADARLGTGHLLHGTLTDAAGHPVAGSVAVVDPLSHDDAGPWSDAGADGRYQIPVNPGLVKISYREEGSQGDYWYRGATDMAHATPVVVGFADRQLDLTVPAG